MKLVQINNYTEILNILEKKYYCKIKRNKNLNFDDDIDIEIVKNNYYEVEEFLLKNNFAKFNENESKTHFYLFIDEELFHLDIIKNKKYLKIYFNFKINNIDLLEDSIDSKFNRYILLLRKEKKSFFVNNKNQIIKNNLLNSFILNEISKKKKLSFEDILNLIKRRKLYNILKIKYLLLYYINRFKEYIKIFNSGKIITILGPDGVGKSTISRILNEKLNGKYIYMGGRGYILNDFYLKHENKKYLKLLIFLMRYTENIIRYIKAFSLQLRGYLVIADRYPKWDLVVGKENTSKINIILHNVFYKYIFPKPKYIFVLYDSPKSIFNRKKELSIKEISKYLYNFNKYLTNENKVHFIKNEKIDNTLNKITKIIF